MTHISEAVLFDRSKSPKIYVASILQRGESVLMLAKLHWIIYAPATILFSAFLMMIVLLLPLLTSSQNSDGAAFMLVAAVAFVLFPAIWMAIAAWFDQWTTEIAVTDKRVIYKCGFIRRHTAEMNMDKVESVIVDQSILGRLLDYGTIHIVGTGEGLEHLHKVSSPINLRNCITAS